jgi:hypothetical protein
MLVFTLSNGKATQGATISTALVAGGTVKLPVVQVGEVGRGRKLSYLPVQLLDNKAYLDGETVTITRASVGTTKNGGKKLIEVGPLSYNGDSCIVILRTHIGFRGGNSHTGDREGTGEDGKATGFLPFPGEILTEGRIAQGDAGNMGSGAQLIVVMPKGVVWRTSYSGRLYGAPGAHYHVFDGTSITSLTWEERVASDLF